jgi:RHS repeat-associated protein
VEKVAGGVTTGYTYDGTAVLREIRGSTTLKYVHGPAIDEPLAVDDGASLSYVHADGLGCVVRMTSAAGAVTQTRQYDAWGNLETGATEPGYAFTGREWDPETGLHYYRARYFDPAVGRFISEDPLSPAYLARVGGLTTGRLATDASSYVYAGNRPTTYTDPLGLCPPEGKKCKVLCIRLITLGDLYLYDGGNFYHLYYCCPQGLGFFIIRGRMKWGNISYITVECEEFPLNADEA